jgi:hypothetical protein
MTATVCAICGRRLVAKHTGRKRHYCSNRCRDRARQDRHYAFCGIVVTRGSGLPRNAGNPHTTSKTYKPDLAGRGSVSDALWHSIVETEIVAAHRWAPTVSTDGVVSQVAQLQPRALRG